MMWIVTCGKRTTLRRLLIERKVGVGIHGKVGVLSQRPRLSDALNIAALGAKQPSLSWGGSVMVENSGPEGPGQGWWSGEISQS